jgi:hypothetical protein
VHVSGADGGWPVRWATTWMILCLLAGTADDGLIASPEPGWPQWRGPHRDGVSSEGGLLPSWPKDGPRLLWRIDGLGRGWSSPIVVGRRLYVTGDMGDDLVVFAFHTSGTPRGRPGLREGVSTSGPMSLREPDNSDPCGCCTKHGPSRRLDSDLHRSQRAHSRRLRYRDVVTIRIPRPSCLESVSLMARCWLS